MGGTGELSATRVGLLIWDIYRSAYGPSTEHIEMHSSEGWSHMNRELSYWENLVLVYSVFRLFPHKHSQGTDSARAVRWLTVTADDFVAASNTRLSGQATALAARKFDLYMMGPSKLPIPSIRQNVEVAVLAAATDELDRELAREDGRARLQVYKLHHDACAHYVGKDFTGSLVTGFPATEALVELWWRNVHGSMSDDNLDDLVGRRLRKALRRAEQGYAGPGIGLLAELLVKAGDLPADLYEQVELARDARNEWIHGMKPVPYAAAEAGMDALAYLTEHQFGVSVPTPGGFQF